MESTAEEGTPLPGRITEPSTLEPPAVQTAVLRYRRIVRWQWLALVLLSAALIGTWLSAALGAWATYQTERAKQAHMRKLKSADPVVRALAARDLQNFNGEAAAQALLDALQDPEWTVRYEALRSLASYGTENWVPISVAGFLSEENPHLQDAAVATLSQMTAPAVIEPLVRAYLQNERLRPQIKTALDAQTDPHISEFFIKALSSPEAGVRAAAAQGLAFWQNPEAAERLIPTAQDPDADVRKQAVLTLGRMAGEGDLWPPSEAVIVEALKDPEASVRRSAVVALGRISAEKYLASLEGALNDSDPAVDLAALKIIKDSKSSEADRLLRQALNNPSPAVRGAALAALGDRKATTAVEAVIARLDDPDESVRRQAAGALGALRDPRGFEPLKAALQKGAAPAHDIIVALGELRLAEAVPLLLEQAHNDDHRLRFTALMALIKRNTPEVEQSLVDFYNQETRPYVRTDLITAVQKMRSTKRQ